MPRPTCSWDGANPTNRAVHGMTACEQALALDRNLAPAHAMIGLAKYRHRSQRGNRAHIQEALRLSPRDPFVAAWLTIAGDAKLFLGSDEEAVARLARALRQPQTILIRISCSPLHWRISAGSTEARAAFKPDCPHPEFNMRRYRAGRRSDNPTFLASASGVVEACAGRRAGGDDPSQRFENSIGARRSSGASLRPTRPGRIVPCRRGRRYSWPVCGCRAAWCRTEPARQFVEPVAQRSGTLLADGRARSLRAGSAAGPAAPRCRAPSVVQVGRVAPRRRADGPCRPFVARPCSRVTVHLPALVVGDGLALVPEVDCLATTCPAPGRSLSLVRPSSDGTLTGGWQVATCARSVPTSSTGPGSRRDRRWSDWVDLIQCLSFQIAALFFAGRWQCSQTSALELSAALGELGLDLAQDLRRHFGAWRPVKPSVALGCLPASSSSIWNTS